MNVNLTSILNRDVKKKNIIEKSENASAFGGMLSDRQKFGWLWTMKGLPFFCCCSLFNFARDHYKTRDILVNVFVSFRRLYFFSLLALCRINEPKNGESLIVYYYWHQQVLIFIVCVCVTLWILWLLIWIGAMQSFDIHRGLCNTPYCLFYVPIVSVRSTPSMCPSPWAHCGRLC